MVEAKFQRSVWASNSTMRNAFARLQAAREKANAVAAILITNTAHDLLLRQEAESYGIIVFDAEVLAAIISSDGSLREEFENLQREALLSPPKNYDPIADLPSLFEHPPEAAVSLPKVTTGEALWERINAITPGREGARKYEQRCEEALRYLFEGDLTAWRSQKPTDQLHRFDLIARVSSRNDFWNCLRDRFGGQYIIFEFKNYSSRIGQAEIFTTEKYLFPKALRTVALLLSRKGGDDHAQAAARGALRESGKVILNLSDDELRSMLLLKDLGEEPSNILLGLLDEMLMSIER
ncbi:MAG TPA: hypothetical protein PLK37_02810 [Terricaulis sp.]|nr:hypothetical protein [Terricaulis sp.]